ncbi:MAG: hypothetical protein OEW39_03120 [Deltaproteobacteria bacterium]|nr:hypothetical protein [Deltaproteobacteria bacterium]
MNGRISTAPGSDPRKRPCAAPGIRGGLLAAALLAAVCAPAETVRADSAGVETVVLATHLISETMALGQDFPRKLDDRGRFVLMPGLEVYYDETLDSPWKGAEEVRIALGYYRDSMDRPSGYLCIGPLWSWVLNPDLRFGFMVGPSFIYRQSWNRVPGYADDSFYKENSRFMPGYQYKFFVGGKLELRRTFRPGLEGVWSAIPGIPYVIVQNVGLRWSW